MTGTTRILDLNIDFYSSKIYTKKHETGTTTIFDELEIAMLSPEQFSTVDVVGCFGT